MSDIAFGIHAVDSLLRRAPQRILALFVQTDRNDKRIQSLLTLAKNQGVSCLLYTSPSPRDMRRSRMPSSA